MLFALENIKVKCFKALVLLIISFLSVNASSDMMAPAYASKSIASTERFLFIGTPYGINIYDKKKQKWEVFFSEDFEKAVILSERAYYTTKDECLSVAVDGKSAWFGFYGKEVKVLDIETGKWETANYPLLSKYVYSILIDRDHNIWFATERGLSKFDGKKWEHYVSASEYLGYGLTSFLKAIVTSVVMDKEGRLWIGSSDFAYAYYDSNPPEEIVEGGITKFYKGTWKHYYAKNFDLRHPDEHHVKSNLISNDVTSLAIDGDDLWIGTGRGISVFNLSTGEWRNYTVKDGLPSNSIISITAGKDSIWVGTYKGIGKYEKKSGKWFKYGEDVLPFASIRSVHVDKYDSCLWAVTNLYAYKDVYVYRFCGKNWDVFPTSSRLVFKDDQELLKYVRFLRKRQIEGVESILKELSKKYPDNPEIQYESLISGKKDLMALKKFRDKFSNTTYGAKAQYLIAKYYKDNKKCANAIEEYKKYLKVTSDYEGIFRANMEMADCYGSMKNYIEQIEIFEKLVEEFPMKSDSWRLPFRISKLYMTKLNDYRSAIAGFLKIYGVGADELNFNIAKCYEHLGEYEKAIEYYQRINKKSTYYKKANWRAIELEIKLGIEKKYPLKVIEVDRFNKDYIWIGSEGGGVFRYDKNNKSWKNLTVKDGLISNIVLDIVTTRKFVWIKTTDGLSQINREMSLIKNYKYVGNISYDGENLWIAEERRIAKYSENEDKWEEFSEKISGHYIFFRNPKIFIDKEHVWFVDVGWGSTGSIMGYNRKTKMWDSFFNVEGGIIFAANGKDYIWCAVNDALGAPAPAYAFNKKTGNKKKFLRVFAEKILPLDRFVWLVDWEGKLYKYDKGNDKTTLYTLSESAFIRETRSYEIKGITKVGKQIWVISSICAARYNEDKDMWEEFYAPVYIQNFLVADATSIWFQWYRFKEHGLGKFDTVNKEWKIFPGVKVQDANPAIGKVGDIEIGEDYVWIISDDGSLYSCSLDCQKLK